MSAALDNIQVIETFIEVELDTKIVILWALFCWLQEKGIFFNPIFLFD